MKFLEKLEKKFGKYSIRNLPLILTLLFAFNYIFSVAAPDIYVKIYLSPYDIFYGHEYWRLVTWIFTAPSSFDEWTILSLVCLYFIGSSAQRGMGTFMYNLYTIGSMLLNLITVLVVSGFLYLTRGTLYAADTQFGGFYVNYTIPVCVFFAFAMAYSESTVFFMFLFPLKAKYIACIDFALLLYEYFSTPIITFRALLVVAVANFFIFYNVLKKYSYGRNTRYSYQNYGNNKKKKSSGSPFFERKNKDNVYNMSDYLKRKQNNDDKQMPEGITRHKCAICGKTENDGEDLVFRFCTKCNGNYEYCSEHIYTHEHVK